MEENPGKDKNRRNSKSSKDEKEGKPAPRTTGSRLKERWLMTRKTWRYMSDAGKKLFPDGVNPHKKEDVAKIEEHFQEVSEKCGEYIVWHHNRKKSQAYESADSEDERKADIEVEFHVQPIPESSSQGPAEGFRERVSSLGDLGWGLPSEIYHHLLRTFGANTLHRVASKLLEEELMEEDEFGYDEDEGEFVEIDGRMMRSIGSQTDPYLDMCVQTDHDSNAEDFVRVGAETRAETEAAVAHERALLQEQVAKGETLVQVKSSQLLYQQPITTVRATRIKQLEQLQIPREISHHPLTIHPQNSLQPEHEASFQHDFQQQYDHDFQQQLQIPQQLQQPPYSQQQTTAQQLQQSQLQQQLTQQQTQQQSQQQHHQQSHQHQQQQQQQQQQQIPETPPPHLQQSQPPVLKKFWARRESLTAKSDAQQDKVSRGVSTSDKPKESIAAKWSVAAKLATLHAHGHGGSTPGSSPPSIVPKPEQPKPQEKKKQNVFKLGLKSDMEGQQSGFNKLSVEKAAMDRFKTINYDKTLRNIKSKWIPSPEEEEYIRSLERANELEREGLKDKKIKLKEEKPIEKEKEKLKEKEKEKKKKKARGIQVGEPLPQFILNSFRINSPVQIIHATRRRLRRLSSKAESVEGSECSLTPSGMISPRFSICILEEQGNRELTVSEAEAYKLTQMGIPFLYKGTNLDASLDIGDLEASLKDPLSAVPPYSHHFQRSLSAVQASGHLSHILCNLRSGRLANPLGGGGSKTGDRAHKLTQSLLQHLLPTVMQRARGSGGGHASRLVAKRIWRTRSKSQSRASAGTTSIWTPMGNCTWMSVTGRVVTLEPTSLLHLSELERLTLQGLAVPKLQAMNLGCQIKIPKDASSSSSSKKRRPYLLKRKALSTGFFETKKEETRGVNGGLVFGLSLSKCIENERVRLREAAEREAILLAAASTPTADDGEASLSRKSSQAGSHASFTSLLEGTKQSTTGSLESLNLERKRPSLGGNSDVVGGSPTSLDLLTIDPQPQVPALVSACCRFLEGHGLHTLGIFRVSSSKKRVRQLREEFDSGKDITLTVEHCPHDVATLLKEFFRDLPEPLLTRELYEPLLSTQKIRNRKLQFEALQYLIQLLPTANRDTLYSLLNFLTTVAEHSSDTESKKTVLTCIWRSLHALLTPMPEHDSSQGNKMDSSNLATLFAPNILHQVKPGSDTLSPSEMAAQVDERMDVINVVRSMIDHNKELFEVTPELLDETYQHLMDTHPEPLDILLRRRCTGSDERSQQYVQRLLATLFESGGAKRLTPPLNPTPPLSPPGSLGLDLEVDTSSSVFEGSEASSPMPRSPTDHHDFEKLRAGIGMEESEGLKRDTPSAHENPIERTRRRRRHEEEESKRVYQEKRSSGDSIVEEKGWFRRREKSGSRESERGLDQAPERTRWFRRRDKSCKASEEKSLARQGSDKSKEKGSVKRHATKSRERLNSQSSIDSQSDRRGRILSEQERLKVPEPSVRRLSSPEIDSLGVITASLKIPVPLHQQPSSLAFTQETDIPYIEDSSLSEEAKMRLRESVTSGTAVAASRPRTGSNDSFLGQPITGNMSFAPLSKKERDKRSNDSILSSSSMGVFTMSPSDRNTPSSDFPFASETSSPMSGAFSPPLWLSPDSGTPGLSPPSSPPPRRRSRRREELSSVAVSLSSVKPNPLSHSATHTFGAKVTAPPRTRDKARAQGIGRSRTSEVLKLEETLELSRVTSDIRSKDEISRAMRSGVVGPDKDATKRHARRRYAGERHHTGTLPDVPSHPGRPSDTSTQQLWKRWEIIASDPTEPETFV